MLQRAAMFYQHQMVFNRPSTLLFNQTLPTMGFATKIMGGSTNNKKDSAGRRLGLKKWGHTAEIMPGDIIARQRGTKWHGGMNVYTGKDHTLHSTVEVSFSHTPNL